MRKPFIPAKGQKTCVSGGKQWVSANHNRYYRPGAMPSWSENWRGSQQRGPPHPFQARSDAGL